MQALARGEPAREVDQRAQLPVLGGRLDRGGGIASEQVRLDQVQAIALPIASATCSRSRSATQVATTSAPASSSSVSTARPSPPVPPVTSATPSSWAAFVMKRVAKTTPSA